MKKLFAVLLVLTLLAAGVACIKPEPAESVSVAALMGPTGVGLAYMMEGMSDTYTVELYNAPDQITGKFLSGEVNVAAVPVNLAAVLYQKTEGDVSAIAVNTLGVLYILDGAGDIASLSDLVGKTLYATGQGSTPEYVLSYLLEANGLTDDVTVEYVADHTTLATMLADGTAVYGMLPEPHVSAALAKNANLSVALDLNELYKEASGVDLVQGVYIVKTSWAAEHASAVDRFLFDCAASVEKVNTEDGAAAVVVKHGIIGSEAVAKTAIPQCNVVCVTGEEMKTVVSGTLDVLFAANPAATGGALPGEDFCYAAGK